MCEYEWRYGRNGSLERHELWRINTQEHMASVYTTPLPGAKKSKCRVYLYCPHMACKWVRFEAPSEKDAYRMAEALAPFYWNMHG